MAPLMYYLSFRKVLILFLVLFLFTSVILCTSSDNPRQLESQEMIGTRRRMLLELEEDIEQKPKSKPKKIKSPNLSTMNQTKLIKSNLALKNQTKLIKTTLSSKNLTKLTKSTNSTKSISLSKLELKKLNSTSKFKKLNSTSLLIKLNNSTSKSTTSTKKTSDLLKLGSPKNKTTKPTFSKQPQTQTKTLLESQNQNKTSKTTNKKLNPKKPTSQNQPNWLEQGSEDDLVSEFRDLPSKFQETLFPDLEKISLTSQKYLTKANKEMTKGFKPIVGKKYAATIASFVSFAFIIIPLLVLSLFFNRIKAYFSLQKLLIFIQVYLSIYFSILCLSSLVTGLEPLRFFFATSQSTYVCVMVLQTLAYVLYLLLLLMYLILVFSTDCGPASKMVGLVQTFVGFSIGLHFYVAVFHRVVLHQPPKTTWKVHGIYATCFFAVCMLALADRRKKAYLEDGGEENKKN